MKNGFYAIVLLILTSTLFTNCTDSTNSDGNNAKLSVYLTDAGAPYDSVIIVFSEISAHIDSQWVHVKQEPIRVNLSDWSNGETLLLGSADVPAGKYTQIRLKIDSAFVGINGQVFPMTVPSGAKTGLKFGPQFSINEGSTYKLVFDFDSNRSVVVHGSKRHPHSYSLKPHIRMMTYAVTGSISGTVLNHNALPAAHAIIGLDTLTTSIVDTTSGYFKLAFLPDSVYSVVVKDTSGRSYTAENIEVVAGQNNNLGELTLQ